MGPPNQSLPPPSSKENSPNLPPTLRRRNGQPEDVNPLRLSSPSSDIILHNYGRIQLAPDEKPSYEKQLESSQGQRPSQNQRSEEEENQFTLLRDSMLFNHERMQHGQRDHRITGDESFLLQDPTHHPSLYAMNPEGSDNYLQDPDNSQSVAGDLPTPKLYSVQHNYKNQLGSANKQPSNISGLTSPNKLQQEQGKALSGTAASLHLPSPPTTPFIGGDTATSKEGSGTVVTVYSYRCERPTKQQRSTATVRSTGGAGEDMEISNATVEDEMTPIPFPEEKEGEVEQNQLLMKDSNKMLESTQTDTNLMMSMTPLAGEHATDEDLDDQTSQFRQSPPFFANPEDLKWPELANLRMSLPQQYQPLLANTYKKDPRTWLWKNAVGRRARQILAGSTSTHAIPSSDQQRQFQQEDPGRQLQRFENLPDGTTDTDLGAGRRNAFDDHSDSQMLVDKEGGDSLTGTSPRRDSHFLNGGAPTAFHFENHNQCNNYR